MANEILEALKADMIRSEFVVGSYVKYPNRNNPETFYVGRIKDIPSSGMPEGITIENDRNQSMTSSETPIYRKDELLPVLLSEGILINDFGFEKKVNKRLYGLPPTQTYFELKLEGKDPLQMIEAGTARFCMVIPSDGYYGCAFIPIIHVHRLQNIIAVLKA